MFKKFFDGLLFGSGFGIAFLIIWIIGMYFVFPRVMESQFEGSVIRSNNNNVSEAPPVSSNGRIVSEAPAVRNSNRYLGSTGSYTGDFHNDENKVLSIGKGIISGVAQVNDKPLEGLKLRLALNGTVMSQWATTDSNGIYRISVPYGEYQIDGYEIDSSTADKVLPNKINHPRFCEFGQRFEVKEGVDGEGIKLGFVDPIIKKLDKKKYLKNEKVIASWEPYPEAIEYKVQISEKPDAESLDSKYLFVGLGREKPKVSEPQIDLSKYPVELKSGYFYIFDVEAINSRGSVISETTRKYSGYDFKIED